MPPELPFFVPSTLFFGGKLTHSSHPLLLKASEAHGQYRPTLKANLLTTGIGHDRIATVAQRAAMVMVVKMLKDNFAESC